MVPQDDEQRIISNKSDRFFELRGEIRDSALEKQKDQLVNTFYNDVAYRYNMRPNRTDSKMFRVSDDGKTLFWVVGDKSMNMSVYKVRVTNIFFSGFINKRIQQNNRKSWNEGNLKLPNYTSKTGSSQQVRQVLESTLDKVSNA